MTIKEEWNVMVDRILTTKHDRARYAKYSIQLFLNEFPKFEGTDDFVAGTKKINDAIINA